MTPDQILSIIGRLFGGNISAAARFLGRSPRQMYRITDGERKIPKAEAMLLRLMIRLKLKPDDVESMLPKG